MAIQKQDFYEGAALYRLARGAEEISVTYCAPYFLLNGSVFVLLKYSTQARSPWTFTFAADEQLLIATQPKNESLVLGLVCGSDGIVALEYAEYQTIAKPRATAVRVACYRSHGEHYEVRGPDGTLSRKISPSSWTRILKRRQR